MVMIMDILIMVAMLVALIAMVFYARDLSLYAKLEREREKEKETR